MKFFLAFVLTHLVIQLFAQPTQLEPAFNLKETPAIIEGMTYDPVGEHFYFGESVNRRLLKYTRAGKSAGFIDGAKDGMTSVLGMSVFRKTHHLWVCGAVNEGDKKIMCAFQYDLKTGKLINRYPDTSAKAKLFNDVTVTEDGSVYITDTYTRSLYTIDTINKIAVLYRQGDSLRDLNGITSKGKVIYISTSRGFTRINTADKSISVLNIDDFMIAGNDGLYYYKNSLIGIQNVFFPITVGRYYMDSAEKKIQHAKVLVAGHPSFKIPTTGAIVGNEFYFMANNNLGAEDSSENRVNDKKIKPVELVKVRIE